MQKEYSVDVYMYMRVYISWCVHDMHQRSYEPLSILMFNPRTSRIGGLGHGQGINTRVGGGSNQYVNGEGFDLLLKGGCASWGLECPKRIPLLSPEVGTRAKGEVPKRWCLSYALAWGGGHSVWGQ